MSILDQLILEMADEILRTTVAPKLQELRDKYKAALENDLSVVGQIVVEKKAA